MYLPSKPYSQRDPGYFCNLTEAFAIGFVCSLFSIIIAFLHLVFFYGSDGPPIVSNIFGSYALIAFIVGFSALFWNTPRRIKIYFKNKEALSKWQKECDSIREQYERDQTIVFIKNMRGKHES